MRSFLNTCFSFCRGIGEQAELQQPTNKTKEEGPAITFHSPSIIFKCIQEANTKLCTKEMGEKPNSYAAAAAHQCSLQSYSKNRYHLQQPYNTIRRTYAHRCIQVCETEKHKCSSPWFTLINSINKHGRKGCYNHDKEWWLIWRKAMLLIRRKKHTMPNSCFYRVTWVPYLRYLSWLFVWLPNQLHEFLHCHQGMCMIYHTIKVESRVLNIASDIHSYWYFKLCFWKRKVWLTLYLISNL